MNISGATLTLFGSPGSGGIGQTGMHRHHHHGGGDKMKTIADTLGISTDQLKQEMSSGSSLAQIAQNHGKTADDLVDALQDKAKSRLDQAVSNGRITQDQETQFLSQLKSRETSFVNGTPPSGPPLVPPPDGGGDGGPDDVASLLGAAGLQGASSGQTTSIGQALKAYGVDTSGLEKQLVVGLRSALDKAVTAGKLTNAQEHDLMSQIRSSLDQTLGADDASSAGGTDATNPDLASLLFKDDQSGSSDASSSNPYAQSWMASINVDFAA